MDIVKKNWLSILFGLIAIAAIVADFYPMGGMREKLKTEASARAAVASQLQQLSTKQRNLPIVDPKNNDPKPLEAFPIQQTIDNARKATELVSKAAVSVLDRASTLNQHTPLEANALPGQLGQAVPLANFARKYIAAFPQIVQNQTGVTTTLPGDIITSMKGGFPPTEIDISAEKDKVKAKIDAEDTQYVNGQPSNADQVKQMEDDAMRSVADNMRADVAKKCLIYVDPNAFAIFPGIQVTQTPEPSAIFWAQIGLWVQQDVAKSLLAMNEKSANVMEAPVKELMKIGFEQVGTMSNGATAQTVPIPLFVYPGLTYQPGGAAPQPPAQGATPPPADATARDYTLSPTGRESNPMYDVVHFDVDLIVDASSVPQVMAGLEAGQYINVIQMNSLNSVDSSLARNSGYFYGDKPCVQLHLRCEELFLRKWLQPLMPPAIQAQLNIQPATGTPAAPGTPGAPGAPPA